MILISSNDINFPYGACEGLYKANKQYNIANVEFDKLIECLQGNFWAVCSPSNELMGCLYFELRYKNKWFISGFSVRGVTVHVTPAIHCLIEHYGIKKVYSETPHRHARLALLRTGFKKIRYNIYKWEG